MASGRLADWPATRAAFVALLASSRVAGNRVERLGASVAAGKLAPRVAEDQPAMVAVVAVVAAVVCRRDIQKQVDRNRAC
jgi:hypothetical protein